LNGGVVITGDTGKQNHIRIGDGLGIRSAHAYFEVFQIVTVQFLHLLILLLAFGVGLIVNPG
jgi:hypothetical protein